MKSDTTYIGRLVESDTSAKTRLKRPIGQSFRLGLLIGPKLGLDKLISQQFSIKLKVAACWISQ